MAREEEAKAEVEEEVDEGTKERESGIERVA